MNYKLDIKDRKILYQLDLDARIPTTLLAKKVGLSQPSVYHRLNNLIDGEAIKFFLSNIDYSAFGYFAYRFFCRLQDLTIEKEQELIKHLQNHEYVPFLASCTGRYDLMFCLLAKNPQELKKLITEIKNKFGIYFSEQQNAILITGAFYPRDYLLGVDKRKTVEKKEFAENVFANKLDKEDLIILKELSKDCRISFVDLAKKINLSLDTVRYRMKNLQKSKILNGNTIYLDNKVLNQSRYKIMIQLRGTTEQKENQIITFAQSFANVVYAVKTFGVWDLELDVEVDDAEKFMQILREIKNKNSDLIREYQTIRLTEVYKYNHLPMNVEHIL